MDATSTFLIVVSIFGLLYASRISSDCQEPPNVEEIKQRLNDEIRDSYMESMSYFNIKHILNEVPNKLNISYPNSNGQVLLARIYGDLKCRRRHQLASNQTHERSSCPWYYALEVDWDREPQTIVKAKCSCKRCLDGSRRSKKGSECQEISYHLPVIRRQCEGYIYKYGIFLENVAVGCTCQRFAKEIENNTIPNE
ncbi:Interleukin-17 [Mactra antiquata]